MQIVSYGGGTNSTAMLVGLHERGERPDAIVFADTGGEKPHTYTHIVTVSEWCESVGFPRIVTVKGDQPQQIKDGGLYEECLRLGVLPSKAYGFGSCSMKWKIDPQRKFDRVFCLEQGIEQSDLTRLVGFDADEPSRMERAIANAHKTPFKQRFPLIEWDWGRDECVDAITRAGLPQPGKSACFFCPSSKLPEIRALKRTYPILLDMAIEMERKALAGEGNAPALRGKGLGRSFSWAEVVAYDDAQMCMFSDAGTPEVDCGCYDGESALEESAQVRNGEFSDKPQTRMDTGRGEMIRTSGLLVPNQPDE
jgi:hypothetical protein